MATADLNFCTCTCSCILNMLPKPFCGFMVFLVVVHDGRCQDCKLFICLGQKKRIF